MAPAATSGNSHQVVPMTKPHDLKTIGLKATLPRLKILNLF